MAETSPTTRIWLARGAYVLIGVGIVYVQLLPLQTVPRTFAMPDWLLCLTLVWVARRPDYVPVTLIAVMFLFSDLMVQRPPGLWTALVLILTEALRARSRSMRNLTLPLEWMTIGAGIVAIYAVYRFTSAMTLLPEIPLAPYLVQMVTTILAYPVVAGLSYLAFGVARPAPGAVDALGHRL